MNTSRQSKNNQKIQKINMTDMIKKAKIDEKIA